MAGIYKEENGFYALDCTNAIWATDEIHAAYQKKPRLQALKDVDWIIETEQYLILVEYKNASVSGARNPEYNPFQAIVLLARKYYDSLHYLSLLQKEKPKKYVCVLEWPKVHSVDRKRLRDKLMDQLPFDLPNRVHTGKTLIESVDVLSIREWNSHPLYGRYPLRRVHSD